MRVFILILIGIITVMLIKEKYDKLHISEPSFKAVESYHIQWIAISILWFIAGVFFTVSYFTTIETANAGTNNSHLIAIMYYYIAIVYVMRGFSKDILCKECLWTSKGKVYWKNVSSYRGIDDEISDKYFFLEVITNRKTIVMKFLKSDKASIETLIKRDW